MTFHEKTILQICTANFIISEMNRQVPPILLKAELSVMLFRKFFSVTTISESNSKVIMNSTTRLKIASNCQTLFDLF